MTPLQRTPNACRAGVPEGRRGYAARDSAGLATLEWLLVIAAAGGFAAVMAVAFGGIVDDAGSVGGDADAELVDAGIAAARISDDAITALIALENSSGDPDRTAVAQASLAELAQQCAALESAYPDAISSAQWTWTTVPVEVPATAPPAAPGTEPSSTSAPPPTTRLPAATLPPVRTSGRWVCQIGHRTP